MSLNSLSNYNPEISLKKEITFEYKKELFKVHVSVFIEEQETFYKLYFKNNFKNTDKSLMKLFRKANGDGSFTWNCKEDYFSYNNDEIAAVAGSAIDKFLREENIKELMPNEVK